MLVVVSPNVGHGHIPRSIVFDHWEAAVRICRLCWVLRSRHYDPIRPNSFVVLMEPEKKKDGGGE